MKLVVTQPFADYKVGDSITDQETIKEVLEERPGSVVKAADDPAPDADTTEVPSTEVTIPTSRTRR
jgi:hypothetical protein